MAQTVNKKKAAKAAAKKPSDMEVLHPEQILQLGGARITVREYGNLEWLRALSTAEPLVAAIADMLKGPDEPGYELALFTIAMHIDALIPLIVQTVDRDLEWFERLPSADAELLLMAWWGVNGHFFVQRASNRVEMEMVSAVYRAKTLEKPSAGAPSTQP